MNIRACDICGTTEQKLNIVRIQLYSGEYMDEVDVRNKDGYESFDICSYCLAVKILPRLMKVASKEGQLEVLEYIKYGKDTPKI